MADGHKEVKLVNGLISAIYEVGVLNWEVDAS